MKANRLLGYAVAIGVATAAVADFYRQRRKLHKKRIE